MPAAQVLLKIIATAHIGEPLKCSKCGKTPMMLFTAETNIPADILEALKRANAPVPDAKASSFCRECMLETFPDMMPLPG